MKIIYDKENFNLENSSCIYVNGVIKKSIDKEKEHLSLRDLLKDTTVNFEAFFAIIDASYFEFKAKFTAEQSNIILLRVKKQALRSLLLETVYNLTYQVPKPKKYYSYVNSIQKDDIETFKVEIFTDYKHVKNVLDLYYRSITLYRQRYFFELAFKTYIKSQKKKFLAEQKKISNQKEFLLLKKKKEIYMSNIEITESNFARKMIQKALENSKIEIDISVNTNINFIKLLHIYCDQDLFERFMRFMKSINTCYSDATKGDDDDINASALHKQVQDYMYQISIYVFFIIQLQGLNEDLKKENIFDKKEDITFNFESSSEMKENTLSFCEISFVPFKDIFIDIPLEFNWIEFQHKDNIIRYVNKLIALLNLMENFYLNKLLYLYLIHIKQKE